MYTKPPRLSPSPTIPRQDGWAFFNVVTGQRIQRIAVHNGQWLLVDEASGHVRWSGIARDATTRVSGFIRGVKGPLADGRSESSDDGISPLVVFEVGPRNAVRGTDVSVPALALLRAAKDGREYIDVQLG